MGVLVAPCPVLEGTPLLSGTFHHLHQLLLDSWNGVFTNLKPKVVLDTTLLTGQSFRMI